MIPPSLASISAIRPLTSARLAGPPAPPSAFPAGPAPFAQSYLEVQRAFQSSPQSNVGLSTNPSGRPDHATSFRPTDLDAPSDPPRPESIREAQSVPVGAQGTRPAGYRATDAPHADASDDPQPQQERNTVDAQDAHDKTPRASVDSQPGAKDPEQSDSTQGDQQPSDNERGGDKEEDGSGLGRETSVSLRNPVQSGETELTIIASTNRADAQPLRNADVRSRDRTDNAGKRTIDSRTSASRRGDRRSARFARGKKGEEDISPREASRSSGKGAASTASDRAGSSLLTDAIGRAEVQLEGMSATRAGLARNGRALQTVQAHAGADGPTSVSTTDSSEGSRTFGPQVVRGVMTMLRSNGGSLTMKLNPPALGSLRIQMTVTQDRVSLQFHAQSGETQRLLQSTAESLRSALESQGLKVEQMTIQPLARPTGGQGSSQPDNPNSQQQQQQQQAQHNNHNAAQDHDAGNNGQSRGWREGPAEQGGTQPSDGPQGEEDDDNRREPGVSDSAGDPPG